ncbi:MULTISPECIES: glycine cleavage system aminomethyltransferase GcvT [unclassified Pseudonocardia]|uniref:glycine cleavage system aminomethyltransferase GcvT n=1 Tax=unclassified Pseudonocardia TaxID=2619320 RepID=UPI0006CB4A15|nr:MULTISPECIES: glycine cleavage system aminomethyltransferase GcvT [unclassified Pseudonocardia]ALE72960.1 glycine cleavage system protein T [Pseudonocardia sp. EC080625-04]ALL76286.1 glycine cleavage system protein T [Pseudonocardia sp. EC080610-09]ALL83313.1 glycine cleavage system protein T [Pseudonocardia sp. EC080619-01]OLM19481.1 Aminomethyltransferase (glycine cleavage system T protein) [Pseudonocardia sp. Ae707_Ps1]
MTDDLLPSPLHDRHVALDATLGEFGGWSMPISYPGGTVAEHTSVREAAGLFDVSHLGTVPIAGPGAAAHVNTCLTNDLGRIGPGRAQYTLACNEAGGVLDDMIIYMASDDDLLLVPNAANSTRIVTMLQDGAPAGVTVTDRHRELAVLALQGPRSGEALAAALGEAGAGVADLDYMAFTDIEGGLAGGGVRVCRTGYTGEHGYEVVLDAEAAPAMWDALLDAVRAVGGGPCGLAARDTLRTEMGYPLHGHELSEEISPVQAGSAWAVGWDKPSFWGREALTAERAAGPARRLRALRATGRGVPRAGMTVLDGEGGSPVGTVTSGTFSPTLKTGVALALIATDPKVTPGDQLVVDVRGRVLPVEVVKPPMVPSRVR